jgi:hypothetical protein
VTPHAEVERVWPRDGLLRVTGRLHGAVAAGRAGAWSLHLVRRDAGSAPLRRPAPLDGLRFDVTLPVADLVPADLAGLALWDLYLTPGGPGERLRVGRLLDDITGKKKIMVFPEQVVPAVAPRGGHVLVRPYYTVKDNLSVEVRPAP